MASALLCCKDCELIIMEVPLSAVPFEIRCPECRRLGTIYWYKRSKMLLGDFKTLKYAHHLFGVPSRGRLGFMLKLRFRTAKKKEEEATVSSVTR